MVWKSAKTGEKAKNGRKQAKKCQAKKCENDRCAFCWWSFSGHFYSGHMAVAILVSPKGGKMWSRGHEREKVVKNGVKKGSWQVLKGILGVLKRNGPEWENQALSCPSFPFPFVEQGISLVFGTFSLSFPRTFRIWASNLFDALVFLLACSFFGQFSGTLQKSSRIIVKNIRPSKRLELIFSQRFRGLDTDNQSLVPWYPKLLPQKFYFSELIWHGLIYYAGNFCPKLFSLNCLRGAILYRIMRIDQCFGVENDSRKSNHLGINFQRDNFRIAPQKSFLN